MSFPLLTSQVYILFSNPYFIFFIFIQINISIFHPHNYIHQPLLFTQETTSNIKMQFLTLTALATLFAALTSAAPALEKRQFEAQITFVGAAAGSFSMGVPTDGTVFSISMFSFFLFSPTILATSTNRKDSQSIEYFQNCLPGRRDLLV